MASRGGAAAWRKIQTKGWTGRIESGPGGISKTPFLMMFWRPNATRPDSMVLMSDPTAKGIKVALKGMDSVEGHRAYHLKITLPSGQLRDDWIDAQSFLELRYDRETHSVAGATGVASVYLRNYSSFEGLFIPLTIETGAGNAQYTDKMSIQKIALNPAVSDSQFASLTVPVKHHAGVVVDTRSAGAAGTGANP